MEKTQNTDTKESNTHDKISTEETDRKTLLRHCGNTEKRSKNLPHVYTRICCNYYDSITIELTDAHMHSTYQRSLNAS